MDKVASFSDLQTVISNMRNSAPAFVTNYYPDAVTEQSLISDGGLSICISEGVCLIIEKHELFDFLSFAAVDNVSLKCSLRRFLSQYDGKYVTDIVGRESQVYALQSSFEECGFSLRNRFQRMFKLNESSGCCVNDEHVLQAELEDVDSISHILHSKFDQYSERLPSSKQLSDIISAGGVYKYGIDGKITGLIIFDSKPTKSHLRYWVVEESFRDKGIGSILYNKMMNVCRSARRCELWVVSDNINAVKRYSHYGYRPDGLIDNVLTYNVN